MGHNVKVISLRENKIYKDTKIIYVEDVNRFQKVDKIYSCYKIERWFFQHKIKTLAVLGRAFIRLVFSADIPYKAKIGKGTKFPHDALGVVMHPDTVIGENCKILHGTTFGGNGGNPQLPIIGNNVMIGAHAQIIGLYQMV